MASEVLQLTAQIVMSHASMTELSTKELLKEIKEVYGALCSLECQVATPATPAPAPKKPRKVRRVKMKESREAKAVENEDGPVLGERDYIEFMDSREG